MHEIRHYLAKVDEHGQRAITAVTATEKSASVTIAQEFLAKAWQAPEQLDVPSGADGGPASTASPPDFRRPSKHADQCL